MQILHESDFKVETRSTINSAIISVGRSFVARSFVLTHMHCVISVRIRSYSGPYFPTFRLNTKRYGVSLRIQSECGKIRTRITPNIDTFYAVKMM